MGMYRWAVYFLKEWGVPCDHVHGFNMDEWSDAEGNTLASDDPGAFQNAMRGAFYGPLGELTVPESQRHFAVKEVLPTYADRIGEIKSRGGKLGVIFGIGRVCHIAFWEPQFAGEYDSVDDWKAATHRIGAKLHPLTIEQNALTSFKSRTTLVPRPGQHDRPRPVPPGGHDHRRGGRPVRPRHAVAGPLVLDDPPPRPDPVDPQHVHAHAGGEAVLSAGAGGAAGGGV